MRDFLGSFWAEPRVPNPPARTRWDWVLVSVVVATSLFEVALRADMPWRLTSLVMAVGLAPTLLWRRSHPLPMVVVAFGSFIALDLYRVVAGGPAQEMYTMVYVLLLAYALFRWGSGRHAAIGLGVMMVPAVMATLVDYTGAADAIGGFSIFFFVVACGATFRYRARERVRLLDQVKLREREQLARDLHDTVAHHVSAIAIRAQAGLATSIANPDAALEALRLIEAEASRTLTEMRSIVGFLRHDEPADLAPAPHIRDLEKLALEVTDGPPVSVGISGNVDDLSPSVSTAIYRMAQESITNARRHARRATRIVIDVTADDACVHLRVHDDGDTPSAHAVGSGYGLVGMVERAQQLGGTCEAGPDVDRGWTMTAALPRHTGPR